MSAHPAGQFRSVSQSRPQTSLRPRRRRLGRPVRSARRPAPCRSVAGSCAGLPLTSTYVPGMSSDLRTRSRQFSALSGRSPLMCPDVPRSDRASPVFRSTPIPLEIVSCRQQRVGSCPLRRSSIRIFSGRQPRKIQSGHFWDIHLVAHYVLFSVRDTDYVIWRFRPVKSCSYIRFVAYKNATSF